MSRYLSGTAGGRPPAAHLAVAIATDPDPGPHAIRHRLRRWVACLARRRGDRPIRRAWYGGRDPDSFWHTVRAAASPRLPLWVWCHDAPSAAILLDLFGRLDRGELLYESPRSSGRKPWRGVLAIDGAPFIAHLRFAECSSAIWMVDTCNYWSADASTLADAFAAAAGLTAAEQTGDPEEDGLRRAAAAICAAATETTRRWADADMGSWRPTASSLSLESFRRLAADERLPRVRGARRWNILLDRRGGWSETERESYYGGLIEARYIGVVPARDTTAGARRICEGTGPVGPIYHLDVASLYPSVMRDMLAPTRRLRVWQTPTVEQVRDMAASLGVIARVEIDSDSDTYPVRVDGLLHTARGRYWTTLAGPELVRALDRGHVAAVDEARTYSVAPIFKDWVDEMWGSRMDARRRGDAAGEALAKMLLNGLSGKFAQRSRRWEDRPRSEMRRRWGPWTVVDVETGRVQLYRAIAGIVQRRADQHDAPHAFPAISAWITAAGREHMRRYIDACPPGSVLYQAVDALLVTTAGRDALAAAGAIADDTLGALRVVATTPDAEIIGHGCYRVGDRWVASGLWGAAWEEQAGVWIAHAWRRLASHLADAPTGELIQHILPARMPRPKAKGTRTASGWVTPLDLSPRPEWSALTPRDRVRRMAEFL